MIYPEFKVGKIEDLLVKGKAFLGVWDDEAGMWSTDELTAVRLVDNELWKYVQEHPEYSENAKVNWMRDFTTNSWTNFTKYVASLPDSKPQLDNKLVFSDTVVKKKDYASKRLPYSMKEGDCPAYEELIGTLYDPEERAKLEWAIGAIISGDSKKIQKFVVMYGEGGKGKGTILEIIYKLFQGYCATFNAKSLTSSGNSFATSAFNSNPLVAIQFDGDLSKIEDNSTLNSIISHEDITVNEKYKAMYSTRVEAFLFMGTNKPVKISDSKSGLIRRLIDVYPSGRLVPEARYHILKEQIDFELGAIAAHCLKVYRSMGIYYYSAYVPVSMIMETDTFYNFVESNYEVFSEADWTTTKLAYDMYRQYQTEAGLEYQMPRNKFAAELKSYFKYFYPVTRIDGKQIRSVYSGFLKEKFQIPELGGKEEKPLSLVLDCTESLLDEELAECKAQYSTKNGVPYTAWDDCKSTLGELDTTKEHYVKIPENMVVIDFDLEDEDGNKSMEKNLEAASKWPPTYAEYSRSGKGIHLHYFYDGDSKSLASLYDKDIEIKKVAQSGSLLALRRRLSKCNNVPIAHINSGLPLKEEVNTVSYDTVKSERALRDLIVRNLNKEIHPGTKPSIDFIYKILEDAYKSELVYDVTDMRPRVLAFANNSTHWSSYCTKLVAKMHFQSEIQNTNLDLSYGDDDALYFFDVEVFPNLFIVCYKKQGGQVVKMINPTQFEIETLSRCKLIGFNCRRYDNHIMYGRMLGYNNEQLYNMSQRIIGGSKNAFIREAYNFSYTDVYDLSSKKQSLKKFEIELGIHHQELDLPWDQPVPEELWEKVAEYCANDVIATEAVFENRKADWTARQILADVAGLSVNDTTNTLTQKIIFGDDRNPQSQFNYRLMGDWRESKPLDPEPELDCDKSYTVFQNGKAIFPEYTFSYGKSWYRDEDPKEGGYVYAEPGMYGNVALLDIASMHPSSIIAEELFGPTYTARFKEILDARLAIKHNDFDSAKKMLGGKLAKYMDDESQAKDLAQALKIAINSVYGLTSAKFENRCRDPRNVDNIVAKRGALFMINLKHEVQNKGFTVAHIKTDSIKIPDATPEIIQFVMDYGKLYGYTFEHEATYDRMCLVNDAVYIAKYNEGQYDKAGNPYWWTATGAQFQVPYVFKTLFSHEDLEFSDFCETKSVSTSLYLDMNEGLGEDEHKYVFVGKVGSFCPIKEGCGGGELLRFKDDKYYAATGAKGYRWLEAETVKILDMQDDINVGYYEKQAEEAKAAINNYGDFDWFVSDEPYVKDSPHILPF